MENCKHEETELISSQMVNVFNKNIYMNVDTYKCVTCGWEYTTVSAIEEHAN